MIDQKLDETTLENLRQQLEHSELAPEHLGAVTAWLDGKNQGHVVIPTGKLARMGCFKTVFFAGFALLLMWGMFALLDQKALSELLMYLATGTLLGAGLIWLFHFVLSRGAGMNLAIWYYLDSERAVLFERNRARPFWLKDIERVVFDFERVRAGFVLKFDFFLCEKASETHQRVSWSETDLVEVQTWTELLQDRLQGK